MKHLILAALVAASPLAYAGPINLKCEGTHTFGLMPQVKRTEFATWYPEDHRLDVLYSSFKDVQKHPTIPGDYVEQTDHHYAGINRLTGRIVVMLNRGADEKYQVYFTGHCERATPKF